MKFTHADQTVALAVQDFAYGKYLGHIKVVFDDKGNIKSWKGNPILLNSTYKQDPDVLKMVEELVDPILKSGSVS